MFHTKKSARMRMSLSGRARTALATVIAAGCVYASGATSAQASTPHWIASWGASMVAPTLDPAGVTPTAELGTTVSVPLQFSHMTIRNVINPHYSGTVARIRLSNEFGTQPITFQDAYIGDGAGAHDASIVPGSNVPLTFDGKSSVTIQPGATAESDPANFRVTAFHDVVVSFYLPTATGPATQHTLSQQLSYLALGDQASATSSSGFLVDGLTWYFLDGLDVQSSTPTRGVIALGDSLTDGFIYNTINANHRYPDYLAQRFQANPATQNVSVINEGISGNRLLSDNIGPSIFSRFQTDVLDQPGATDVILEVGINDIADPPFIGLPAQQKSAAQIIAGLERFAALAHSHGLKVYGTTITPAGDLTAPAGPPFETYSLPYVNQQRELVNAWMRSTNVFDGVIDFDKVLAKPTNDNETKPQYMEVDGVHPNDAGYEAMANAVPLSWFTTAPNGSAQRVSRKHRTRRHAHTHKARR